MSVMWAASSAKLRRSCFGLVLPLNLNENLCLLGEEGVVGDSKYLSTIKPIVTFYIQFQMHSYSYFDNPTYNIHENLIRNSSIAIHLEWSIKYHKTCHWNQNWLISQSLSSSSKLLSFTNHSIRERNTICWFNNTFKIRKSYWIDLVEYSIPTEIY